MPDIIQLKLRNFASFVKLFKLQSQSASIIVQDGQGQTRGPSEEGQRRVPVLPDGQAHVDLYHLPCPYLPGLRSLLQDLPSSQLATGQAKGESEVAEKSCLTPSQEH